MSTTTDLTTLKINYLSQAQYDAAVSGGTINENEIYMTPADANTYYLPSATTITISLDSGAIYLVILGRFNTTAEGHNGMYIITAHSTASTISNIKSSSIATVSVSKTTLTVTTSITYVGLAVIKVVQA